MKASETTAMPTREEIARTLADFEHLRFDELPELVEWDAGANQKRSQAYWLARADSVLALPWPRSQTAQGVYDVLRRVTDHLHELSKDERDEKSVGITGWAEIHEDVAAARALLSRQLVNDAAQPWLDATQAAIADHLAKPVKDAAPAPVLTEGERWEYDNAANRVWKNTLDGASAKRLLAIIDRLTAPQPEEKV